MTEKERQEKVEERRKKQATNRSYYEKNKVRIQKQRARRYKHDEEYKEKAKVRRKKQAEQEKQDRQRVRERKRAGKLPKKMRVTIPKLGSIVISVFTLGQLCTRIGLHITTIYKWERQEVIPQATYFTPRGWRLYTVEQAETIERVFRKHRPIDMKRWRITDAFIEELHAELGKLYYGVRRKDHE